MKDLGLSLQWCNIKQLYMCPAVTHCSGSDGRGTDSSPVPASQIDCLFLYYWMLWGFRKFSEQIISPSSGILQTK